VDKNIFKLKFLVCLFSYTTIPLFYVLNKGLS